ncbi:uncharacterized protein TRAVEDRAFT_52062 [Trametes versicolor FP-101664 SS1]|uniref:uncharacterized protein n=1 Tax=Trametes versicolor (strain FP-101664) TaxID=717944 RepID=UPI000462309C|nr:uncharacterized protein TRAVEDRAFT_52062 [Trametes versicolor FP-101664 SS1]EIW54354.1 hypothetical protein TRAVEDRAFT_52062 [Trametes versicolor FP-101664 SS1]
MANLLSADVSEHVTFVYPTTQFIPPLTRALAVRVVNRIPKSTECTTSTCTAVPAQCAMTISPAWPIKLSKISTTPASAADNSLSVSTLDNEVADKDDLVGFLSQTLPDITNRTFTVQSQGPELRQLGGSLGEAAE